MRISSLYLIRNVLLGFVAAAALLLPLFSTFDLVAELEDVAPGGYRWSQALEVVLMTIPRRAVDLGPFIALLGGITALGQLAMSNELTAFRTAGISIIRIGVTTMTAGLVLAVGFGAMDEWIASPLQQRALQIRSEALAITGDAGSNQGSIWAKRSDVTARVGLVAKHSVPMKIEIFRFTPQLTLSSYIYADRADVRDDGTWLLHDVNIKEWHDGVETTNHVDEQPWKSIFSDRRLKELTLPTDSFSIKQLYHYIEFLKDSDQPSAQYQMALWQKLGRPILTLAMILFSVPFTFAQARSPGLGGRLAFGAVIGLLIYISNQIIVNFGLLLNTNTLLTTLTPSVALLGIALLLVYRFDRGR